MNLDSSNIDRGSWPKAIPLLVLAGLLAYCNSFTKAFVFDDIPWISANPDIADSARFLDWSRPVVRVSILFNYWIGGLNPPGYHALNLAVHILAGLTLYGLVRRVLLAPRFAGRYDDSAAHLAFGVSLLWLVHPLQTQAVTYVIQRCESMMGLFYLFTLYGWVRGTLGGRYWYALAVVSFAFSAGCKEVAITLPPVLVIFDRIFLATSWRELVRSRWLAYLGIFVVWGVVAAPMIQTAFGGSANVSLGFGIRTATPFQYLMTQAGVILHYLRLSVWPTAQALDYLDWPIAKSFSAVWLEFIVVAGLLAASLILLIIRPVVGFVLFWFFALLAPTSSIMPIQDAAFEHRMYLSLVTVSILAVFAMHALGSKLLRSSPTRSLLGGAALATTAIVLITLTFSRNETYRTHLTAWEHAANARPKNPRAWLNLAVLEIAEGKLDDGETALQRAEALSIQPALIARQRASLLVARGRIAEAEPFYRKAIGELQFDPSITPVVYRSLAWTQIALGKATQAVETMRALVELQPTVAENHLVLAAAELAAGRANEATVAATEATRLDPNIARNATLKVRAAVFTPEAEATALSKPQAMWVSAVACMADGDHDPLLLDTLAAAYAWNARYADAVDAARRGITAAEAWGDRDWAGALRTRLKLYESGKPYAKGS